MQDLEAKLKVIERGEIEERRRATLCLNKY
jgi:hypothetical protein